MITIPENTQIFICQEYLDFRTSFNGTAAACRLKIGEDPLKGGLFVFINRKHTMIRCYFFDGHGEWLIMKRKASGKFKCLNKLSIKNFELTHLILLLRGADPTSVKLPEAWKDLSKKCISDL